MLLVPILKSFSNSFFIIIYFSIELNRVWSGSDWDWGLEIWNKEEVGWVRVNQKKRFFLSFFPTIHETICNKVILGFLLLNSGSKNSFCLNFIDFILIKNFMYMTPLWRICWYSSCFCHSSFSLSTLLYADDEIGKW